MLTAGWKLVQRRLQMGQRRLRDRAAWQWLASGTVRTAGKRRRADHAPHTLHRWPRRQRGWSSALQAGGRTERPGPASLQSPEETPAQIVPAAGEQSSRKKSNPRWGVGL